MAEDADIETAPLAGLSRRGRALRVGGAAVGVIALALGGLWMARKPIAIHFIAQALREKGVAASYDVVRIGPRTQRLEHLVLGDPRHPDLIADWVEVDLGYGFSGVRVTGLRTGTVTVNAAYRAGKLQLGSLDRLLPQGGGGKAELPDIDAQLSAVRVRLASDFGTVDLGLNGAGNLRSGFNGALQAAAPRLALGGCSLDGLTARTSVSTAAGQVQLKGPVAARNIACADSRFALDAPRIDADVRTDPALSDMNGAFALAAAGSRLAERSVGKLSGLVTAKGSTTVLRGSASLAAEDASLGFATVGTVKLGGDYALRPMPKDRDYSYAATMTAEEIRPASQADLGALERQVAGTPLRPLAKKFADALQAASRANRLTVSGRVSGEGPATQLLVNGADFAAASGAHVATREGSRLALTLPNGKWSLDGGLESGGGGLPEATLAVQNRPGGGIAGVLTLRDYRAGSARLGLTPVHVLRRADGTMRINTNVTLDGPLSGGAVKGLQAPVDVTLTAKGGIILPRDCAPLRWSAIRVATISLDPARIDLCGLGGSRMRLAATRLRGRIGESPFNLAVERASFEAQSGQLGLAGLDMRIGAGPDPVVLKAGTLDGALGKNGSFSGALADGSAIIGTVPLNLGAIAGQWQFRDGDILLDGALRVTDRQADARFKPIDMKAANLTLSGGRITATGTLVQPDRKVNVATVKIAHDLGSGEGRADFAIDNLRFGNAIQPDDLTPLALGVIVNVDGAVQGGGTIRWSGAGVTSSTGDFSTQNMNFAAAFGPVTGFATKIHFTDLLGLKTAPHQRLTVRQVSAGVDVFDGVIDYAILSNEAAQIEDGRWPFSGGTLELLPARLNLDARQPRHLTFRVTGIDAGAFIQTMDLENVSATGTFDGLFPMIFDERGGRIEGGLLVARQAGLPPLILSGGPGDVVPACNSTLQAGMLSYVGPVSDAELGTMGKMAFNVLKRLGYKCLTLRLDGALDGEFITQVRVNGINLGSKEASRSFLTRPFVGLPFIFNVRIEAPFRGLLSTAASFADPRALIRDEVDRQISAGRESPLAVQPGDSDKDIEGKTKE